MASVKSAEDLLAAEIKDLYSAEKQLTKALPKMIAGAKSKDLKAGLKAHLEETKQQVVRLETIAGILGGKASGKLCKGMEGVISECAEALSLDAPPAVFDLGLIAAARRVEHYEMAGYLTAIALAEGLGAPEVVKLLNESLTEENAADSSLTDLMPRLLSEFVIAFGKPVKSVASQTDKPTVRTA
jgi:ferritin-like metal-binding protein YciE